MGKTISQGIKQLISQAGEIKARMTRRKRKEVLQKVSPFSALNRDLQQEKELAEQAKFNTAAPVLPPKEFTPQIRTYQLPVRYYDNRIVLLPRDPWWLHTYWDIAQEKIDQVVSSIPQDERQNLKWILRVYDTSGVSGPGQANSFFDLEINLEARNWYINVNQPERDWCVEIGLKSPANRFFVVARSNIVKTPCFGISSLIDEEWALSDEEYFRLLGIYDLGRSSLEIKKRLEEIFKRQISSPGASWGISSLFSERAQVKDKFFLKVWTDLILYGRTEPDAEVTIEGKKVTLRPDGSFSLRYTLPEGDFQFKVTASSQNKKYKIEKTPAVKRYNK